MLKALGVLIVITSLVFTGWWVLGDRKHKRWAITIGFMGLFAGFAFILNDRITKFGPTTIEVGPVATGEHVKRESSRDGLFSADIESFPVPNEITKEIPVPTPSSHSPSSITITKSGIYVLTLGLTLENPEKPVGYFSCQVQVKGPDERRTPILRNATSIRWCGGATSVELSKDDVINILVGQSSGETLTMLYGHISLLWIRPSIPSKTLETTHR